jgi:hypothetical protein
MWLTMGNLPSILHEWIWIRKQHSPGDNHSVDNRLGCNASHESFMWDWIRSRIVFWRGEPTMKERQSPQASPDCFRTETWWIAQIIGYLATILPTWDCFELSPLQLMFSIQELWWKWMRKDRCCCSWLAMNERNEMAYSSRWLNSSRNSN